MGSASAGGTGVDSVKSTASLSKSWKSQPGWTSLAEKRETAAFVAIEAPEPDAEAARRGIAPW